MAGQCEMIVGYLVPHRCEHPALGHCIKCGRGYCEEHMTVQANGLLCLACQQGLEQPIAVPLTARSYDAGDLATFAAASQWEDPDAGEDDKFAELS